MPVSLGNQRGGRYSVLLTYSLYLYHLSLASRPLTRHCQVYFYLKCIVILINTYFTSQILCMMCIRSVLDIVKDKLLLFVLLKQSFFQRCPNLRVTSRWWLETGFLSVESSHHMHTYHLWYARTRRANAAQNAPAFLLTPNGAKGCTRTETACLL